MFVKRTTPFPCPQAKTSPLPNAKPSEAMDTLRGHPVDDGCGVIQGIARVDVEGLQFGEILVVEETSASYVMHFTTLLGLAKCSVDPPQFAEKLQHQGNAIHPFMKPRMFLSGVTSNIFQFPELTPWSIDFHSA